MAHFNTTQYDFTDLEFLRFHIFGTKSNKNDHYVRLVQKMP